MKFYNIFYTIFMIVIMACSSNRNFQKCTECNKKPVLLEFAHEYALGAGIDPHTKASYGAIVDYEDLKIEEQQQTTKCNIEVEIFEGEYPNVKLADIDFNTSDLLKKLAKSEINFNKSKENSQKDINKKIYATINYTSSISKKIITKVSLKKGVKGEMQNELISDWFTKNGSHYISGYIYGKKIKALLIEESSENKNELNISEKIKSELCNLFAFKNDSDSKSEENILKKKFQCSIEATGIELNSAVLSTKDLWEMFKGMLQDKSQSPLQVVCEPICMLDDFIESIKSNKIESESEQFYKFISAMRYGKAVELLVMSDNLVPILELIIENSIKKFGEEDSVNKIVPLLKKFPDEDEKERSQEIATRIEKYVENRKAQVENRKAQFVKKIKASLLNH